MPALSIGTAAAVAAGSLAVGAYLNAKYHLAHDLRFLTFPGNPISSQRYVAKQFERDRGLIFHILEDQALRNRPNDLFLMFEGRTWTYSQFFNSVTRVGNWLMKELAIQRGEIVALIGGNSPEYLIIWYALEGIGAVPSFVNNNLNGQSLLHCIKICDGRNVLADEDDRANVETCSAELKEMGITTIYYSPEFVNSCTDSTPLPRQRTTGCKPEDMKSMLYTSGTTGLPKGIIFVSGRELMIGFSIAHYLRLKPSDRIYTCMPLYHGAAHGLAVVPAIHAGCTIVLGRKFSHKRFWPEVRESKANIMQYVGELCRYLLNAPPSPLDKQHNVQVAWGNGMRPDVREKFRQRFGIPVINELYAATDGMGATYNENRGDFGRNAIGKRGLIWNMLVGPKEVRVRMNIDSEEIERDTNGFAIKCNMNEPGEVVHQLDPAAPEAAFQGYYGNEEATQKRMIRDLFKKGDLWFRSGDMMRVDEDGRVYFVDRLGDTFRWKSENVSTNEVGDTLGQHPQIAEANVYGVAVPHADGRCGCAAIVLAEGVTEANLDLHDLARHVLDTLPRYAVPLFIRLTPQLDYTGTLKLQKGRLKREGIDVEAVGANGDKLYWLPANSNSYVLFSKEDHESLKSGRVRL